MKKHFFNFLFFFLLVVSVSAQSKEARKFDEFGNIGCEDIRNRLDVF